MPSPAVIDARQPGAPAPAAPDRDAELGTRPRSQAERAILCVACGHRLSDTQARIQVAGRHAHTCVNPSGYVYRIGCFRSAPGCAGAGEWSTFWSWFAGYAWQVACCASCSVHVGWAFQGADGSFHGLVLDRIREDDAGPSAPS